MSDSKNEYTFDELADICSRIYGDRFTEKELMMATGRVATLGKVRLEKVIAQLAVITKTD